MSTDYAPGPKEPVGIALPREIARCRGILAAAKEIGPAGRFLVAELNRDLSYAEKATQEMDYTAMVRAWEILHDYKR